MFTRNHTDDADDATDDVNIMTNFVQICHIYLIIQGSQLLRHETIQAFFA